MNAGNFPWASVAPLFNSTTSEKLMKSFKQNSILSRTLAAGFIFAAAWSPASQACSDSPILASICIMATPSNYGDFNNQYMVANGRELQTNQYAALYSLIGNTYGGIGPTKFNLPDLRGRVILGSGPAQPDSNSTIGTHVSGEHGGKENITLTIAQLPEHTHKFSTANVDFSTVKAATTLSGLNATANLGGVKVSGAASGLTLSAATNATTNDPTGAVLATASATSPFKMYSGGTPSVAMNTNSIGGNLSLTIANGTTAPVTVSGNATTTLSGTAAVGGTITPTGNGQLVPTLQPYLVLTYYIATSNATYPTRN